MGADSKIPNANNLTPFQVKLRIHGADESTIQAYQPIEKVKE